MMRHPWPRVICPECGKDVAGRPARFAYQPSRIISVRVVWHNAPGLEQPGHMHGRGCPGRNQIVQL